MGFPPHTHTSLYGTDRAPAQPKFTPTQGAAEPHPAPQPQHGFPSPSPALAEERDTRPQGGVAMGETQGNPRGGGGSR